MAILCSKTIKIYCAVRQYSIILLLFLYIKSKVQMMNGKDEQELRVSTKEDESVISQRSSFILDYSSQQSSPVALSVHILNGKKSTHLVREIQPYQRENEFQIKLLRLANQVRTEAQGAKLYTSFLMKLQKRERMIEQAVKFILQNRPQKECDMKLSLLYLSFISYYSLKHHERKLNKQFDSEQLLLVRTNSQYCKEQMLIQINYKELEWENYGEKIALLDLLTKRVEGKRKELQIVLGKVAPILHFLKWEDMHSELKTLVRKMWENSIEQFYSSVSLQTIFESFNTFVQKNKVNLIPSVQELRRVFQN